MAQSEKMRYNANVIKILSPLSTILIKKRKKNQKKKKSLLGVL